MIDGEGFGELVAQGPMFHLVRDATPATVGSVLEHGLERTRSIYPGFWESRAGHVYLGRPRIIRKLRKNHRVESGWAVFAVDVGRLDRSRVSADEDHFGSNTQEGGFDVSRRFRLPFSPAGWMWEWAVYLGIHPPASLGEWANAIDLGADPEQTRYSAARGSIAYRGVVPPSAIRLVQTDLPVEELAA